MSDTQFTSAGGMVRKQHLIDPETCIRCNTCESRCPMGAITHNADNYVVDPALCMFCMACNRPCPTGAIDNWFLVTRSYTVEEQFHWRELPAKVTQPDPRGAEAVVDALDEEALALLDTAHRGMRGIRAEIGSGRDIGCGVCAFAARWRGAGEPWDVARRGWPGRVGR